MKTQLNINKSFANEGTYENSLFLARENEYKKAIDQQE